MNLVLNEINLITLESWSNSGQKVFGLFRPFTFWRLKFPLLLKRPPLFSDMFHRFCPNSDGEGL